MWKAPLCMLGSIGLFTAGSVHAGITIPIGLSTTAYHEINTGDWLTMGTNDIDGSGGLGTDGWAFAGTSNGPAFNTGVGSGNSGTFDVLSSLPSYVTSLTQGNATLGTTAGGTNSPFNGYAQIDDPVLLDGTDAFAGFWIVRESNSSSGNTNELVKFAVSGLAAGQVVRVGVLSATGDNNNWAPTSISLTDGGTTATIGSHGGTQLNGPASGVSPGWVFFDIDADGDYIVQGTDRFNAQGAGIGGLTFDSVPEPGSLGLLGLGGLCLLRRRHS
ncbi:MAG: PEP-CTERM sorting domain-containing protein [Phycisphaeraceae bacterium]|nr:PEP-CTERM sorting domain-containing protein [Phycisphaeraceae bacterium]